jgi:hypothetical protein
MDLGAGAAVGADLSATPDMGADMSAEPAPDMGAEIPRADDDMGASDAAAGGTAELGRGKRA